MFKNSRIYVAGHTGLLGSALVKKLQAGGYTAIITRTHRELDLTCQSAVDGFFEAEQPEHVFLCAGLTGGITANKRFPARFLHVNAAIQDAVFQAAQRMEVKHLVFFGSSCVYPKHCPQPMKEDYLFTGAMEETSEAYAIAKASGIIACRAYNREYDTRRFIALIPNSMYGPGDNFDLENSHVLSALMRRFHEAKLGGVKKITLWGSGSPRREFVFSEDVAAASIFAVENAQQLKNAPYNVGNGIDYSIKELAELMKQVVGIECAVDWDTSQPDGTPRKLLDSARFSGLGWKPSTDFKDGLKETYEWFKNSLEQKRPG
jgi:GDP-L-fucose synthase